MKEVSYKELIVGKEYIIAHKDIFDNYISFYKGRFHEQYNLYYQRNPTITFRDVLGKSNHNTSYINRWDYNERDTFYEIDTINKDYASDDIKYLIDVQLKF